MKRYNMGSLVVKTEPEFKAKSNEQSFKILLAEGLSEDVISHFNDYYRIDLVETQKNLMMYLNNIGLKKRTIEFCIRPIKFNEPYYYNRIIRTLIYRLSNEGVVDSFRPVDHSKFEVMEVTLSPEFVRDVKLNQVLN